MMTTSNWASWAVVLLPSVLSACLPADTRPPPGQARVIVAADDALASGFTTTDGWNIAYDRFLLALGEVDVGGGDCVPFAESDYLRLFDMRVAGPHTVNTLYAMGQCQFGFRVMPPSNDVVLSLGVDEAAKNFMLTPGSDAFAASRGIVLHVAGTATRDHASYRFAWSFRREVEYRDCGEVAFRADEPETVEIRIRSETLFRDGLDDDAPTKFDPFPLADADGDRDVTLEELGREPLTGGAPFQTYAERLYLGLVPRLARFRDTSSCSMGQ